MCPTFEILRRHLIRLLCSLPASWPYGLCKLLNLVMRQVSSLRDKRWCLKVTSYGLNRVTQASRKEHSQPFLLDRLECDGRMLLQECRRTRGVRSADHGFELRRKHRQNHPRGRWRPNAWRHSGHVPFQGFEQQKLWRQLDIGFSSLCRLPKHEVQILSRAICRGKHVCMHVRVYTSLAVFPETYGMQQFPRRSTTCVSCAVRCPLVKSH